MCTGVPDLGKLDMVVGSEAGGEVRVAVAVPLLSSPCLQPQQQQQRQQVVVVVVVRRVVRA